MKKETFYSLCLKSGIKIKVKRTGYIIKTKNNRFGIFKNEFNDFDIIDLTTGLSINFLNYYKLKDFKNNIYKFDKKLQDYKNACPSAYNNHKIVFDKACYESEV